MTNGPLFAEMAKIFIQSILFICGKKQTPVRVKLGYISAFSVMQLPCAQLKAYIPEMRAASVFGHFPGSHYLSRHTPESTEFSVGLPT